MNPFYIDSVFLYDVIILELFFDLLIFFFFLINQLYYYIFKNNTLKNKLKKTNNTICETTSNGYIVKNNIQTQ